MEVANEISVGGNTPQESDHVETIRTQKFFLDHLSSTIASLRQSRPKELASEIQEYQKEYLSGEALPYYKKPDSLTQALKVVEDDAFIVFLNNLKPPLNQDTIKAVLGYIEGQGCLVHGFKSAEKAQKFIENFNGYKTPQDYLHGITIMATFKADYTRDSNGGKLITTPPEQRQTAILINESKIKVNDFATQLMGLAHEAGHVNEIKNIRGNRNGTKMPASEPQPVTEYIASLYGMEAAIIAYRLGAGISLVEKGFLSNLLIFTNSIGEISHFEEFI